MVPLALPGVAQPGGQHELARQLPRQRRGGESFFQLLKGERIRHRIYMDREEARCDVFGYIEMFYPKRRHGYANRLSPVEFEKQYFNRLEGV